MKHYFYKFYFKIKFKLIRSYHFRFKTTSLEKILLKEKKTDWLDIGSSKLLENSSFKYLDLFDPSTVDIFILRYRTKILKNIEKFNEWACTRILRNSPDSDYFSIFTHSVLYEQYKWCYNKEGLINKISSNKSFVNIRKLNLFDKLSSIPFTHNRPEQDLCIIAQKK